MAAFVDDEGGGFRHVADDEPVALRGDVDDLVWDGDCAGFSQEGFEADVVDEEFVLHAEGEAALEVVHCVDWNGKFGLENC